MTLASMTNCIRMSRRRAPRDLRMPISWVRSVTLASMMFMMTMPPTTMKTATIPMVTAKMDAGQLMPGAHDGVGRVDAEVVVFTVRNVAPGPHQGPDLILQHHHLHRIPAWTFTSSEGRGREDLAEGREGNLDELVLALAKRGADFLRHADHPEGNAVYLISLSMGSTLGKTH